MARAADAATRKIMRLLTATPGVNANLEVLAELEQVTLPAITDKQIATQNMAAEVAERSADVKYPVVHVYCEKIANTLREKFRTFSGEAHMAIEVRLSQDRLVLLCYKRTIWCRIVSWAKTPRQAHRNSALRHISRAWRKPQGMPIAT